MANSSCCRLTSNNFAATRFEKKNLCSRQTLINGEHRYVQIGYRGLSIIALSSGLVFALESFVKAMNL